MTKTSIKYNDEEVVEETIQLFKSGSNGKVFYAGGPVWAMDWLPFHLELEPDCSSQYVALSAYSKWSEVSEECNY